MKRVRILAQEIKERLDAAAQDPAKIGEGHKAGVEQIPAIALDKRAHILPFFRPKFFHDGDAQGLAMLHPELQEWLRELFENVHEPGGATRAAPEVAG